MRNMAYGLEFMNFTQNELNEQLGFLYVATFFLSSKLWNSLCMYV